jgi:AcrR family transcriptional regulator
VISDYPEGDVMTPPKASLTARERARAELTREIKEEARRQLAGTGADGLSLRAVARELGMVSSALYRYFPSKDDLLTALIIDAYDAVGERVEAAITAVPGEPLPGEPVPGEPLPGGGARDGAAIQVVRERWLAGCRAVRGWARAHPHEYALIYGSPVPGYQAPESTIGPAARVPFAMISVLRDAAGNGLLPAGRDAAGNASAGDAVDGELADQAVAVAALVAAADPGPPGDPLPADVVVRAVIAWAQVFGMVSFELFGQFANTFDPADALFDYAAGQMVSFVLGTGK